MKITLDDISESSDGPVVAFSSDVGAGRARCRDRDQRLPGLIGSSVDVEFDVHVAIQLGQNAFDDADAILGIYDDGIAFEVEAQDDDGMTYCRLSRDCLVMIESSDALAVGQRIRLRVPTEAFEFTLI